MGDGTENNPYLINTAEDWNNLADYVEAGNDCDSLFFMMTDNIGTIDEPITKTMGCQTIKDDSNSRKRFAGIFDGDNHTLTISLTSAATNKNYCAPFAYVKHATIKNLHVAGALTATGQFASGLVGSSGNNRKDGNCIIQNCQVSVEITANYISNNGRYGNHGGFIGIAEGTATIENSWFDGKFLGLDYQYSGGFIGINKGVDSKVTNCLFNPSEITIEDNNVKGAYEYIHSLNGGSHVLTDAYWVMPFGKPENAQGQRVVITYSVGETFTTVKAADSNTYYIITGNSEWHTLKQTVAGEATSLTLDKDYMGGVNDEAIIVPAHKEFTLNMNGHTIDRGLTFEGAQSNGFVIKVEKGAKLTINGGTISGGNNTGNGGGIYNAGALNINGTIITGNYIEGNGGGIYNTGTMNLDGASITGNIGKNAQCKGVGVYVAKDGIFNAKGNVFIKDNYDSYAHTTQILDPHNAYFDGSTVITITSELDSQTTINVEGHNGVFTEGLSQNGTLSNFRSDHNNQVILEQDGEARLVAKEANSLSIKAYSEGSQDGWYLIASPVSTTPAEATNLLNNNYDLYRFNATGNDVQWENYKQHSNNFNIVPGKGYLYANNKDVKVTFIGIPYEGEGVIELTYNDNLSDKLKGLNLVGNPFNTTATLDDKHEFYVMNSDHTEVIAGTDRNIAPMEGVFVIAQDADDQFVTFTPASKGRSTEMENIVLNLEGNHGNVIDRAIIRFNTNRQLPKFMINDDNTKIYIPQNGKDYAIVSSEANGEMPINFKAAENGTYTLTVSSTLNSQLSTTNYLHLIDNKTGMDIDLLQTPSYSFEASKYDYASRFRLVFSANNVNENDNENTEFAFIAEGNIIINGAQNATVQVMDMLGRVVVTKHDVSTLSTEGIAPGVYMICLIGENVKTQKIVVR